MSDIADDLALTLGGDPMTRDLDDIRAVVRFRGDYRNTVRFPAANIDTEIQAAFGELWELIADTNEGYWDVTATVVTIASDDFVALPVDVWRVRKISRVDGSDFVPLVQVGIDHSDRYGTATDKPRAFRLTARGADLYPTPDAIYTLRVAYTPRAPNLALEGQREYYNGWEEYVIYGALLRLTLNEHRDASQWQQQIDFQRARITRGASQRKAQEPDYLILRDGYDDEFAADQRWR
jgi:hypothetical protein